MSYKLLSNLAALDSFFAKSSLSIGDKRSAKVVFLSHAEDAPGEAVEIDMRRKDDRQQQRAEPEGAKFKGDNDLEVREGDANDVTSSAVEAVATVGSKRPESSNVRDSSPSPEKKVRTN